MEKSKKTNLAASCVAALALLVAGCEGSTDGTSGSSSNGSNNTSGTTGIAGSTARMVIVGDYLYAIAQNKIQLFDITIPSSPAPWVRVTVDWDIQTLFPYEDYLLVGAADAIHIMDNTDPAAPRYISEFRHAEAIDPVVAANGYAYVTLKNDPFASVSVDDQMNVISLADFTDPQLVKEIPMNSPEGLSVVEQSLFVCDGRAGIKRYDISDPANPSYVDVIPRIDCNDVIAYNGILYAITDTSLQQYDYSVSPPSALSIIETNEMSPDALASLLDNEKIR